VGSLTKISAGVVLILFFIGCSSPLIKSRTFTDPIELSWVERLKPGVQTKAEIVALIGNPDQIITLPENEEAWFYHELDGSLSLDRLSLVFDAHSGVLLTATWLPPLTSPFIVLKNTLDYYRSARFVKRDIGWIAQHEYSDDVEYGDQNLGLTLLVNKTSKSVSAISYRKPTL
jgi:hypothetical protein